MRIFRYLKSSPGKGFLLISKTDSFSLDAYVDDDLWKCLASRKSVTGFCVFFCGKYHGRVKSKLLSRSSTKSEYKAMAYVTCEVLWILNILSDLGIKNLLPINL